MILESINELHALICLCPLSGKLSAPAQDIVIEELTKRFELVGKSISPWLIEHILPCCNEFDTPEEACEFYKFWGPDNKCFTPETLSEDFLVFHLDPDDHPETDPVLIIEPEVFTDERTLNYLEYKDRDFCYFDRTR